jgi:hypothetical protein
MSDNFEIDDELLRAMYEIDEYDPVEALERSEASHANINNFIFQVSNDQFLTAIFGNTFDLAYPLVCQKPGDPDNGGWKALCWPTDTSDPHQNWYTLPSLYKPDETGRFRAKKQLAISVHATMIDDISTKVVGDRFSDCPPSWAIETSPGNFQYGYLFVNPITDLDIADELKEKLIEAGLCDSGATGGTARWMRLPVGINGRLKYGSPAHRCRLTQWRPDLKYTVEELHSKLQLRRPHTAVESITDRTSLAVKAVDANSGDDAALVITALKEQGLYKNDLGSGKHNITCPWVKDHTDSLDNGAAYFEPSRKYPTGGFRCHHSHGNLFHIRHLKEFLGIGPVHVDSVEVVHAQQLPPALRPVPPLDSTHLPFAIRDAVADVASRLNCPPDYLVVALLSAAGSVIGNKIGIFPYANDESWHVFPALWGGIVGDPGSKKSPSLQQAHVPLQHLENQAAQKYAQDMVNFEQAKAQHEQAMKAWSTAKGSMPKPLPPPEPKRERFVVHDTTYQALGVILADNPRGVLALADELSGLLQSLDTAGQEPARGFYLSGWSGTGSYSFDRIGRGSITLLRYCLSVFGGFQPDRIKAYVKLAQRGSSRNDGLLQRFQLLVWPDPLGTVTLVDRAANQAAVNRYHQAVLSLPQLDQRPLSGAQRLANGSQLLHFSPVAQQIFNSWYIDNEKLLTDGGLDPARQSHFAKYRSLVPALALLFHLLDGHTDAVCADCLTRAIGFTEYLKRHANRIYASVSGHDHAATRALAKRLLDGQLADGFTCRTLTMKGWSGFATREQAQSAIDALVEYGWLIETEIRTGGRPSTRYTVNPCVTLDLL